MANNNDFKKIGAGWKKKSKAGNVYLSLVFDPDAIDGMDLSRMNIMVFAVKEKKNDKSPDYTISATEKSQQQRPKQSNNQSQNYAPKSEPSKAFESDDDLPF